MGIVTDSHQRFQAFMHAAAERAEQEAIESPRRGKLLAKMTRTKSSRTIVLQAERAQQVRA